MEDLHKIRGSTDAGVCADILSDSMAGITLFLPTNDAVNATLTKFGLDLKGLLENQSLVDEVIAYHILPSPIEVRCPLRDALIAMVEHAKHCYGH